MTARLALAIAGFVAVTLAAGCLGSAYYRRGDHNYAAFEEPERTGECRSDEQCVVSGCNDERCTARDVAGPSACGLIARPQGRCGCLDGMCVWRSR